MARLTKAQREELERQRVMEDAWELSRRLRAEEEDRRRLETEELAARRADNPFLYVISGADSVPAVEEESPFSSRAFSHPGERQEEAGLLGDAVIQATSGLLDVGAGVVDALAPDPNALASDPSNPFQNALQNIVDTGLRIPVQIDDAVRGAIQRLSPSTSPEALDAVFSTINPYAARAREIVSEREAEARSRVSAGVDVSREGFVNEAADSLRGVATTMRGARSPETVAAEQGLGQAIDEGIVPTARYLASGQGLRALTSTAAGSAPYAALGYGSGALLRTAGLSSTAATAGSGSVMFSTLAANNAAEVESAIMDLSAEEAASNPVLSELMAGGMTLEQAKRTAASQARFATVASMVPTAPLYAMGTFERLGAGQGIRKNILDTLQKTGFRGARREAGQEFVEEASERYASNVGEIAGGVRDEADRYTGVLGSGAVGAAVGGPLGGAAAAGSASTDFQNREQILNALADRLEQRAAERAAARENLEQARFEEDRMAQLAAADAQRSFITSGPAPATDGADNAGRPVESFEQYAAREGAGVLAAEQAQADFLSMDTAPASDQALRNSMREGPRGQVDRELPGTRAQRRAEARREAAAVANEQLEQAAFEEEAMGRLAEQEQAREQAAAQTAEAAAFDSKQTEADLKAATQRHANARRAHLRQVQRDNAALPEAERVEAIRQAALEWDASNPAPTALQASAEAGARGARRGRRVPRTQAPPRSADPSVMREAGMSESEVAEATAEAEAAPTSVEDRIAALRSRQGRASETAPEASDRTPADVIRSIARRVGRGTDRRALAQEQLLLNGKLSVVDSADMEAVSGLANANGYYDGERMYVNSGYIPEGQEEATILNIVLGHEADHAARLSGNTDASSKVAILLGEGAKDRLISRLENDSHPIAQATRQALSARGIDKTTDPSLYEDEITAYAITEALRQQGDGGVWAPIRGIVSAARRKWKDLTGSEDINLNDLAAYAQQTVDALATSEGDISAQGSQTEPAYGRAQIAFHGTPSTFAPEEDAPMGRFRSNRSGTGEGAQVYGAGHYFTQQHGTADSRYRERLVGSSVDSAWNAAKLLLDDNGNDIAAARTAMAQAVADLPSLQPVLDILNENDAQRIQDEVEQQSTLDRGEVYYADIPEDSELAHWQQPIETLDPKVIQGIKDATAELAANGRIHSLDQSAEVNVRQPFYAWYTRMAGRFLENAQEVSQTLAKHGVKGHRFSGRTDGPRNFVIYSDDDVRIVGRDQREAGQDRRSMEQWGEEIMNRPDSSTSLRRQWEEEARASIEPRFSGRASTVGSPQAAQQAGQRTIAQAIRDNVPDVVLDAITVSGSAGSGVFDMNQDLENARNSIYQSALSFDARLSEGFKKAAERAGVSQEEFNNSILNRLSAIAQIPSNSRKDSLIARIAQEHPELHALPEAIQAINAQTDRIINARLADPRPITEEELNQLEYMEANKFGYLTNVYAAFQGKAGKEFRDKLVKKHAKGLKAARDGKAVPASVKREYEIYERALRSITNNDVAVSDPEMLSALPVDEVEGLYDMWAQDGSSAHAVKVGMQNDGTYHVEDYRDILEQRVAEWVKAASPEETRALANIVLNNLLDNHPMSGPAKRYGRGAGLDESIMQHRKDVPQELADLFGKITDIPSLVNATLVRQGELAEKTRFLTRLATESNERGMPYVVSQRDAANPEYSNYTVPLSGESFGPLNGMMATPQVARMIVDYSEGMTMLSDAMAIAGQEPSVLRRIAASKAAEMWAKGAGAQKAMKIITRPDYLLLNFAGSFSTPMLTGGFTPQDFLKGVRLAGEHLSYTINPARDKEVSPELRLVLEMGLFDNAVTQEIRNTPRKMVEQVIRQMGSAQSMGDFHDMMNKPKDVSNRAWNLMVEAYSMSDAWAKIPVGLARLRYLQDYYKANGDNVSNEQIVREAAKFVRDSTIGMQAVPAGLKGLERLGATFYLPYFYSAFRTLGRAPVNAWNDAKMAMDAKTPEARNVAARSAALKVAGTSLVYYGLTTVLQNFLEDMMDDDEREQLERDRKLMFPQDAVGDLLPMGTDELGRRMYFVASRTDQFGPATDIYRALRENDNPDEVANIVGEGLFELLLANRALGWAINTAKDKDRNTSTERVFSETSAWLKSQAAQRTEGTWGVQAVDAALDAVDLFAPAGLLNYFDPENKKPQDVDGQGRAAVAGLMAALGHRFVIIDEGRSLSMAAGELRDLRRDARSNISNTLATLGPQAAMEEMLAVANKEIELVEQLSNRFHAVVESGTSTREAMGILKDSGLDSTTAAAVNKRAYSTEANDWLNTYSTLLSPSALRNPPRPRESMTREQAKEWQREWRRQALEVRRRLKVKSQGKDGDE